MNDTPFATCVAVGGCRRVHGDGRVQLGFRSCNSGDRCLDIRQLWWHSLDISRMVMSERCSRVKTPQKNLFEISAHFPYHAIRFDLGSPFGLLEPINDLTVTLGGSTFILIGLKVDHLTWSGLTKGLRWCLKFCVAALIGGTMRQITIRNNM